MVSEARYTIALLASTQDVASMNVYGQLVSKWTKTTLQFEGAEVYYNKFESNDSYLLLTKQRSICAEHIDKEIENCLQQKIDALVFITKHDSKSGRPSFSVHTQGNWDKAELGGNPQEIAICPIILKHTMYQALLANNKLEGFEVVNECTHHGPSVQAPSMFIEIGSRLEQWNDPEAGLVLVNAIEHALSKYKGETQDSKPVILGFGGTHTCSNFSRLINENKCYLSHVCPEYAMDTLQPTLITQALRQATLQATIIIDWKGMNANQRNTLLKNLESLILPYKTLSNLKRELDEKQA